MLLDPGAIFLFQVRVCMILPLRVRAVIVLSDFSLTLFYLFVSGMMISGSHVRFRK